MANHRAFWIATAWGSLLGLVLGLVLSIGPPGVYSQGPPRAGTRFVPLGDITVTASATELCPREGSRIGCLCTNNDAAVHVRVGDSTVTATKGARLKAGASFTGTSTVSIQAISEGANVTVSCTDERA